MIKEALDSLEKLLSGSLYSCDVEQCNEDYDKVKDYINNLEQQLQAYKDDNKTMTITIRDLNQSHFKILNDLKAYKDKEDKLREELLIWGEGMNPKLQNKLLQILNDKVVE